MAASSVALSKLTGRSKRPWIEVGQALPREIAVQQRQLLSRKSKLSYCLVNAPWCSLHGGSGSTHIQMGVRHLPPESNLLNYGWYCQTTGSQTGELPLRMNEKYLQAFALAYMIGWFLARLPKRK